MSVPSELRSPPNGGETVLALRGVSKSFGVTKALSDVSLEITRGKVHALLGGNGSGKSTLIKILAGVEKADRGTLEMKGQTHDLHHMTPPTARGLGLHFVHQQRSVFPELTVTENLSIGRGFDVGATGRISWRRARRRAAAVLERFHIEAHPDQTLTELGPARQMMVAIARALQDQGEASEDILILDEPTASLPAPEVEMLLDALRRYADRGQSIIYVTHRLDEVFIAGDRATLLRDGQVVDTVEPSALTHDGLVELMMGRTVKQIERLRGAADGRPILEVRNLSAGVVREVDLTLCEGEIVGLAGLIGSGRSTLLKALFGATEISGGEIQLDGAELGIDSPRRAMAAGFAYVPEDRQKEATFRDLTVGENLSITVVPGYWSKGIINRRREHRDSADLFRSFLIKAESDEAPLRSLSGGNQQKVILARWLRRNPRILLLDEPTQGVDVGARAEIYELVHKAVSNGAAALIASSDFEEMAHICDRVLVLGGGRIITEIGREQLDPEQIASAANQEEALR
ncbi:MAG: sugar ABC transporter ATP-binding protein [Solirubrobacterales bacterium]